MRVQLQLPITLDFIKKAVNPIKASCQKNPLISHICTDSRKVCQGDLFIPLPGERYNGEDYLHDAAKKGAYTLSKRFDLCDIRVKDTAAALLDLASAYKKLFSLKETVAITGSVGKSTTKNLARDIISLKYKVHATEGNYNNEIGVPMTIFSMPADTEVLIMETGMNHSGELHRISVCINPSLSVITKIGTSHIGHLGDRAGIAKAKSEIFDGMSVLKGLIPYNEPLLYGFANTKTVSTLYPDADFYLSLLEDSSSISFDFSSESVTIKSAHLSACGGHIPECLAFALAIASEVGMGEADIKEALSRLKAEYLYPKIIKIGELTVIDDSYNSSLESVICALKTLSFRNESVKSALIGDILELGAESARIHRTIGKLCKEAGLDKLYAYGDYSDTVANGAADAGFSKEKIFINKNTLSPKTTARQIAENSIPGEVILFKASNKLKLSNIAELIKNTDKDY